MVNFKVEFLKNKPIELYPPKFKYFVTVKHLNLEITQKQNISNWVSEKT